MRALFAALTVLALILASCASAGPGKVSVTLNEWAIKPSPQSVAAGSVTFSVKNSGKEVHELAVLKTDIAQDQLKARANDPTKVEEPGNLGEIEDIDPAATKELTLTLTPGAYVLVCNIAGHYTSGMHVAFTVK